MAKKSRYIAILIEVGVTVALIALVIVWAYFTPLRDPLSVLVKRVVPQAMVGGRMVSVNDFEQGEIIAARFGVSGDAARARQLQYEKSEQLARQMKLLINNDAAADEFNFYTKGNEGEYASLLESHYENSERLFYKYAIYPQVVDAALRIHYYTSSKGSSAAYKEAQAVLDRILNGESFEKLARQYSDDKTSGSIGGDLGFYQLGQLLPELSDQASISARGEVRPEVITTRLGYHIIYPVSESTQNGSRQFNVKHILFTPEGYDSWLNRQLDSVKTLKVFYP